MTKKYIGEKRRRVNQIFRGFGITPFRKLLTPQDFEQIADKTISGERRDRTLTPEVVFWLMSLVGRSADSMAGALRQAWHYMKGDIAKLPQRVASDAAFTKARKKLPIEFFNRIYALVLEIFYKRYVEMDRWYGLLVKIVDGTTLNHFR